MLKTFFFGILLGLVAAGGALYAFPLVDQYRETSIITVSTNGGTSESFHINIPMDRIAVGAPEASRRLPDGMRWPDEELFSAVRTELFKVRNARDAVIGIAARTAAEEGDETVIDWMLHLPARGSMYFSMDPVAREGGYRAGELQSGSREFSVLSGQLTERWIVDTSGEEDAPAGRLELEASYQGQLEPPE